MKRYTRRLNVSIFELFLIFSSSIMLFFIGFMYEKEELTIQNKTSDISSPSGSGFDRYIRMIFLGSSECGFSNARKTLDNIVNLKEIFRKNTPKGIGFISTGVSTDSTASTGIRFLSQTGPYDEVIADGDIYNMGYMELIWAKGLRPITPQVIVLLEKYKFDIKNKIISRMDREVDIITRAKGAEEINSLRSRISYNNKVRLEKLIGD